jgi:hypothetical protein
MNSSKGKEMMEFFGRTGYVKQIDVGTLIQPHLSAPVGKPSYYDKFWKEYRRFGYLFLAAKYASYNPISIYRLKKSGYLKTESTTE